ncbi:MAG: Fe-S-containing hydro-lyase [Hyphomonadaceae bacterium]|nr:Fe-S-containing hydro-lyase [Clostridia bacterium]
MAIAITTPLTKNSIKNLKAGDSVLLSGTIYTGRDAAHKRMIESFQKDKSWPFELQGQIIYYVGPCPAKPGQVIGSCGPTTSGRMDAYAPTLIAEGLCGMIGKGMRTAQVVDSMTTHGAIYFGALGGAGALIAQTVKKARVVAYEDLGAEAIYKLEVENLPLVVIIDCEGNNLYDIGKAQYRTL